jgi:hypothetical protein
MAIPAVGRGLHISNTAFESQVYDALGKSSGEGRLPFL